MANSVDPDQMPHSVASDLSTLFAKAYLSQYLGLFQYNKARCVQALNIFHFFLFETLNVPYKIIPDDNFMFLYTFFSEEIRPDISRDLSARQKCWHLINSHLVRFSNYFVIKIE